MARVTGAEVKEVFKTDLTASELDPFIASANAVVDRISGQLTTTEAKETERWYAAHLAAAWDQRRESHSGAASKVSYQGEFQPGLYSTDYGQRADQISGGLLRDEVGSDDGKTTAVSTVNAGPQ